MRGRIRSPGNQLRQGIALSFDAQNRRGGVHGARLKLVSRHRDREPEDIVPQTRALIAEAAPVARIGFLGTGPMEALLRSGLLQASGLPVVGIRTGATTLREGRASEWLFHTRAGYRAEVAKVLAHMATIGTLRLGLYQEDSAFGTEVHTLVQQQAGTAAPPLTTGVAEGCIAARTLAEALRRAGPLPTPARTRQALESMSSFDVGGLTIGFTPRDHRGGSHVDIAILDSRGRLLR
ncbi:ABC transporter substrate-binding protein [Aquabacterium sp.]|uniref:ABC transporter substrate-binding protein n=1 Tax=Aquabacterium sp. TaxID=1872578 RepID=UPI003783CE4D